MHYYKLKGGEKNKQYLNYRIGKMHYYGLGTEQNYEKALECFNNAPDNVYAKYMLGKMLYYGQAVEKDYDAAYKIFVSISDENAYASYKAANMIEQGEIAEQNGYTKEELYDQAFVGFMSMEHFVGFMSMEQKMEDDNLEYRIGMMYIKGQGVDEDKKKGIEFLEKSAEAKNVYAMNKLAQIYIEENYQDKYTLKKIIRIKYREPLST
ncbi:sel1 repeat family protein [Parabacteroides distasonis]|nr:sel1 repeat family protein [Parabacteroides distasonis]